MSLGDNLSSGYAILSRFLAHPLGLGAPIPDTHLAKLAKFSRWQRGSTPSACQAFAKNIAPSWSTEELDPRLLVLFASGILPGLPVQQCGSFGDGRFLVTRSSLLPRAPVRRPTVACDQDSRQLLRLSEARRAMATGLLLEGLPLRATANAVLTLVAKDPQNRLQLACTVLHGIVSGADVVTVLLDRGEIELVLRAAESMFPFFPAIGSAIVCCLIDAFEPDAFYDLAILRIAFLSSLTRMIAASSKLKDPVHEPMIQVHDQLCTACDALHQTMWPCDNILSMQTSILS